MVYLLVLVHSGKEVLSCNAIYPAKVEIKIGYRLNNLIPFLFFGNMFYDSVLSLLISMNITTDVDNDFGLIVAERYFVGIAFNVIGESSVERIVHFLKNNKLEDEI